MRYGNELRLSSLHWDRFLPTCPPSLCMPPFCGRKASGPETEFLGVILYWPGDLRQFTPLACISPPPLSNGAAACLDPL